MEREFKVRPNLAVAIVLTVFVLTTILYVADLLNKTGAITLVQFIIMIIFDVALFYYFLGCRPYLYIVKDKEIIAKKRLYKDLHVDLMRAENITDPVPRMADLFTRPHAIEVYMDNKKLYKFYPRDHVGFTGAVMAENKRIHCTVQDYTDLHRSIEKRERKRRRKEEKALNKK